MKASLRPHRYQIHHDVPGVVVDPQLGPHMMLRGDSLSDGSTPDRCRNSRRVFFSCIYIYVYIYIYIYIYMQEKCVRSSFRSALNLARIYLWRQVTKQEIYIPVYLNKDFNSWMKPWNSTRNVNIKLLLLLIASCMKPYGPCPR